MGVTSLPNGKRPVTQFESCHFSNNSAAYGGALFVDHADALDLSGSTSFSNNTASFLGGAINLGAVTSSQAIMKNVEFDSK